MLKWFVLFIVLWWAIVITIANYAHAQPAPVASCAEVLSIEAERNMVDGWAQEGRRDFKDGATAYMWSKGKTARVLLFSPEFAGTPPKGSVFHLIGQCEDRGSARFVSQGQLDGEKA